MLQSTNMTQVVLISLIALLVTSCLADIKCNPQEEVKECNGECKLRICPKHENYDTRCNVTGSCAPHVCDCIFDYKRAPNGTCVPSRQCPKFNCGRPNEEFVACSPLCPTDDCSEATPDGRCTSYFGLVLLVIECEPTCRCIKGYWRKNGKCVPYNECPKKAETDIIPVY